MEHVIKPLIDPKLLDSKTKYYLNPYGRMGSIVNYVIDAFKSIGDLVNIVLSQHLKLKRPIYKKTAAHGLVKVILILTWE